MGMRSLLVLCLLGLPLAGVAKVSEFTLENGLKIIVKEDHRAPVLVSQVWYKVGASYEPNGLTGISHVLEHMMFKGTQKHGPNEFSRIIAAHGGKENAFTGSDYTGYYQKLHKDRLEISFEMEADRMRHLALNAAEFSKEIKVVMEERRSRTDDNPQALTFEHFKAASYMSSPYQNPVIGWMADLENLAVADLQKWYEKWYAPNNATLVVAGDVDAKAVFQLAQKYFAGLKPSELNLPRMTTEVPQRGVRRIVVKAPAQLPYLIMGYHVPSLKTAPEPWEAYALEVMAHILDGGQSARFAKHLIRETQVAAEISTSYDLFARLSEQFIFAGTPSQNYRVEDLEKAIKGQIKRLQDDIISAPELNKVQTQVVAQKTYEKDSVHYQAMQIGALETVGLKWQTMDELVEKVRAVTPAQIQAVAKKYFNEDNLTVAVLEPQPLARATAAATQPGATKNAH